MGNSAWYLLLEKPFFAPPAWIFGPVWSILYLLIFISFGFVYLQILRKKLPKKVGIPFGLNLIFNFSFTPIFFGLENLWLASVDILLVLITIIWLMKVISKHYKWVMYFQIPYLLWVAFATVLELWITVLNW